jgi:hypothetical protein
LIQLFEGYRYTGYDICTIHLWKDAVNQYELDIDIKQILDTQGRVIERALDKEYQGQMTKYIKYEFVYDTLDRITQEIHSYGNPNLWEEGQKYQNIYNGSNQLTEILVYRKFNNSWIINFRYSFTYLNGKLIEKLIQEYNATSSSYSNYERYFYTYETASNTMTERREEYFMQWSEVETIVTHYNSLNEIDSTFLMLNGKFKIRKVIERNVNGLSKVVNSNFDLTLKTFIPNVRFLVNYDQNGVLENVIEQTYSQSFNNWSPVYNDLKFNYTFYTTVSLTENTSPVDLKVYPNPTSDQITISTKGNRINQIRIVDLAGRVVFENQSALNSNEITIPVRQLNNGTYILTVTSNGQQKSQKIVVNH